jgi:hypothetical protein
MLLTAPPSKRSRIPFDAVLVSDGQQILEVRPPNLGLFLRAAAGKAFFLPNALDALTRMRKALHISDPQASGEDLEHLQGMLRGGRFLDVAVLDELIRSAETGACDHRDWCGVLRDYLPELRLPEPADSRTRRRRGSRKPVSAERIATALAEVGARMLKRVSDVHRHHDGRRIPEDTDIHGPLGATLRLRGERALSHSRVQIDTYALARTRFALTDLRNVRIDTLRSLPGCEQLFITAADGSVLFEDGVYPRYRSDRLAAVLHSALRDVREHDAVELTAPPLSATAPFSEQVRPWRPLAPHSPLIRQLVELRDICANLGFASRWDQGCLRPHYGRTARGEPRFAHPPLAALLPEGGFRDFVVAPDHCEFLRIDLRPARLGILAAILKRDHGDSTLAEVLRRGEDPGVYTAIQLSGGTRESFERLSHAEPAEFLNRLRVGDAVNAGVPAGLGPSALVELARREYSAALDAETASALRRHLISTTYPGLARYLADDSLELLARGLAVPVEQCRAALTILGDPPAVAQTIRRIVRGSPPAGEPPEAELIDRTWRTLVELNRNRDVRDAIDERRADPALGRELFNRAVITFAGRVRSHVGDAEAKTACVEENLADVIDLMLSRLQDTGRLTLSFVTESELLVLRSTYQDDVVGDMFRVADAQDLGRIAAEAVSEATAGIPLRFPVAHGTSWGSLRTVEARE